MSNIHDLGIQGTIVTSSSPEYEKAISRGSATAVLPAAYVVYPITPSDIPPVIKFALSQTPPLDVAVKSGGCHPSNASSTDGGVTIDLSKLKAVTVSEDKATVAIQGGAVWGDVYTEVEKHGLAVVGGNVWFVGVGGYTLGGGYSYFTPELGMAIDNLVSAEVVLADGRILRCSEQEEPDLFWAIRGGGNQFGIVTEFVVKAYPARDPSTVGVLAYPGTELSNVLKAVHEFISTQGTNSWLTLAFMRAPPHFYPGVSIVPYIGGPNGQASLTPFRTTVTPVFEQVATVPNYNAVSHGADAILANVPPRYIIGGAPHAELWDDLVVWLFNEWVQFSEHEERKGTVVLIEIGKQGKVDSVDVSATAFPNREPHYYTVVTARHTSPELDKPAREWVAKVTKHFQAVNEERTGKRMCIPPNFSPGPEYVSLEDTFGPNLVRLRKVKAKYDPTKVWKRGWVLEPDFSETTG